MLYGMAVSKVLGILAAVILSFAATLSASAQRVAVEIERGSAKGKLNISGRFTSGEGDVRTLLFNAVQIDGLRAFDADGKPLSLREVSEKTYAAGSEIARWEYSLTLPALDNELSMARRSWFDGEAGAINLGEILPRRSGLKLQRSAEITLKNFDLDEVYGFEIDQAGNIKTPNRDKSLIWFGSGWRVINNDPKMIVSGKWLFSDKEAAEAGTQIYRYYAEQFGSIDGTPVVAFSKFPGVSHDGRWTAVTNPGAVSIVSADMPFETQSTQRMYEQLRHELLHLWLPNRLKLTGNYDWFYEGFAVYYALKTGVELKQIKFSDMVKTLSDAYRTVKGRKRNSLISASYDNRRDDSIFYAEALLTAFICDVEIISKSGGRQTVRHIISKLSKDTIKSDANDAILRLLKDSNVSNKIINQYIKGDIPFELSDELKTAGFDFDGQLKVKDRPSRRQKAILDRLGYNIR